MHTKYLLPINLFLSLEKSSVNVWTSKTLSNNFYTVFIEKQWFYLFHELLSKDVLTNNCTLIEASAIDTINYTNNSLKYYRNIIFYTYYIYNSLLKLSVFSLFGKTSILSVDKLFLNASWLERELSEMYGIYLSNKNDTRKLLLEYSHFQYPLLKTYPCNGYTEIYYDVFEAQVVIQKNEIIEL